MTFIATALDSTGFAGTATILTGTVAFSGTVTSFITSSDFFVSLPLGERKPNNPPLSGIAGETFATGAAATGRDVFAAGTFTVIFFAVAGAITSSVGTTAVCVLLEPGPGFKNPKNPPDCGAATLTFGAETGAGDGICATTATTGAFLTSGTGADFRKPNSPAAGGVIVEDFGGEVVTGAEISSGTTIRAFTVFDVDGLLVGTAILGSLFRKLKKPDDGDFFISSTSFTTMGSTFTTTALGAILTIKFSGFEVGCFRNPKNPPIGASSVSVVSILGDDPVFRSEIDGLDIIAAFFSSESTLSVVFLAAATGVINALATDGGAVGFKLAMFCTALSLFKKLKKPPATDSGLVFFPDTTAGSIAEVTAGTDSGSGSGALAKLSNDKKL